MLINNSSLSPVQTPVQRLHVLRRSMTHDLRCDGMNTCHFPLELHQFLCWPCDYEVVTLSNPILHLLHGETDSSSCVQVGISIFDSCQSRSQLLAASLFRTCSSSSIPLFQRPCPFCLPLAVVSVLISGPSRGRSTCMIENVSLWFAAIDIIAFDASNGGVPAYKSGRSSL